MISRQTAYHSRLRHTKFQSRNRGSLISSLNRLGVEVPSHRFNLVIEVLLISRRSLSIPQKRSRRSFNLVIEVLLISRLPRALAPFVIGYISFQSRNRGSFDFKVEVWAICPACGLLSFNLVIEVLLISSGVINPGQVEVTPGVSIS